MPRESYRIKYEKFWKDFAKFMEDNNVSFKLFVPTSGNANKSWAKINNITDNYRGDPFIGIDLVKSKKMIRVNVYIPNNIECFLDLKNDKNEIETKFGGELIWNDTPKTVRRIETFIYVLDFDNDRELLILMKKLVKIIEKFVNIFEKRLERYSTERGKMSAGLRAKVLKRDDYRCCHCGKNPKEDEVKLHVDHIKAISNGGKTTIDNLQTLCEKCNLGKSSSL